MSSAVAMRRIEAGDATDGMLPHCEAWLRPCALGEVLPTRDQIVHSIHSCVSGGSIVDELGDHAEALSPYEAVEDTDEDDIEGLDQWGT